MNRYGFAVIACALGVGACSHLREPSDDQLVALLHDARISPAEANARLDAGAIRCLRVWSGDDKLLLNLPPGAADEDGRKTCHGRIDALLADASRNPQKFAFAEVTAPKVVQRAIDLEEAHRLAMLANPASHEIPPALLHPPARSATPVPLGTPDPAVDLGPAGSKLTEAEDLCRQVQQAASKADAKPRLEGFGGYCSGNLRQLRAAMTQSARANQGQSRLEALAKSATNMANIARKLLADADK